MRCSILLLLCFILIANGCGSGLGEQSEFDSLIDEVWLDVNEGKLKNAVEYLRAGGKHFDIVPGTTVDQDFVIPLCLKLKEKYNVECYAILYEDDSAGEFTSEILIALPMNPTDRNGLVSLLEETDKRYSGNINQMWGNKWLVIDFYDDELVD